MWNEASEPGWYITDDTAKYWDGEKWRKFKWSNPPGVYEFDGIEYYWNGQTWQKRKRRNQEIDKTSSNFSQYLESSGFSIDKGLDESLRMSAGCRICGEKPALDIILQSASSRIIWWNHSKINAELCAICAERAYISQQSRTLIQGWWGPLSALATVWFSISNIARIDKHRKRIPMVEYEGTTIPRPKLNARSNPGVIIASIIAISIIGYIGSGVLNQPTSVSDSTPTTYNGSCWHDNGNNKLSQVNCTSSEADYETYQVVSDPSLCASIYIAAGTQYACLQNKY